MNYTPEQALAEVKRLKAEREKLAALSADVSNLNQEDRKKVWKQQYAASSELRDEFQSEDVYLAYANAKFKGLVK
jgi:hypothetical protein